MNIPTTLKHKPVFVVENYENVDGKQAYNSSAKGLSLGLAGWNDRGQVDVSAKVWSFTGRKWSSQSEEMPLNRVLDLAIMIAKSSQYLREAYRMPKLYDPDEPVVERVGLQGDAMTLKVATDNEMIDTDIALYRDALLSYDELIGERLSVLSRILKEMGY